MSIRRGSMILIVAVIATGALAQEAPSVPFMDPKVDEVLREMEQALTGASAFAFTAEVTLDELHRSGIKIQRAGRRSMAVRRPDRIVSDVEGDFGSRSAWYDGKSISVLDKAHYTYAVLDIPTSPTSSTSSSGPLGPSGIDAALDFVADEYDIVLPLADFIRTDVHESLFTGAAFGLYVGLTRVGGITCHQVALANDFIEWQLWIDAEGDPLPVKFVITYADEPGEPQFVARFLSWNLAPELPDEAFQFSPPEGARQIPAAEMAARVQTPEEDCP